MDRRGDTWLRTAFAVAARPRLWRTASVMIARLARPGWWRHRPFLPLPDPEYLRFRQLTATGDTEGSPSTADVIAYLEWCRRF